MRGTITNSTSCTPARTTSTPGSILAVNASAAKLKVNGAKLAPMSPEKIISGDMIGFSCCGTRATPTSIAAGINGPVIRREKSIFWGSNSHSPQQSPVKPKHAALTAKSSTPQITPINPIATTSRPRLRIFSCTFLNTVGPTSLPIVTPVGECLSQQQPGISPSSPTSPESSHNVRRNVFLVSLIEKI